MKHQQFYDETDKQHRFKFILFDDDYDEHDEFSGLHKNK